METFMNLLLDEFEMPLRHPKEDTIPFCPPSLSKNIWLDFPGGSVVKNLPANAEDMGSIPGLGRSPMPWGN